MPLVKDYDKPAPDPRWASNAACRGMDPDIFFPKTMIDAAENHPKTICEGCPVQKECLEHALKYNEHDGIWGGTSARERRRIRAARIRVGDVLGSQTGARVYEPRPPRPLCADGCGELVNTWNGRKKDWSEYKVGHRPESKNPLGKPPSCVCGCGLPVKWNKLGKHWNQWRVGHHTRVRSAP